MPSQRPYKRLTVNDVAGWLADRPDALVLDAREAQHHASDHLPGSVRLDGRNHEIMLLREARDRPVLIYCYHGNASQTCAQMFVDFGFGEVCDLIGGWEAWREAVREIPAAESASQAR